MLLTVTFFIIFQTICKSVLKLFCKPPFHLPSFHLFLLFVSFCVFLRHPFSCPVISNSYWIFLWQCFLFLNEKLLFSCFSSIQTKQQQQQKGKKNFFEKRKLIKVWAKISRVCCRRHQHWHKTWQWKNPVHFRPSWPWDKIETNFTCVFVLHKQVRVHILLVVSFAIPFFKDIHEKWIIESLIDFWHLNKWFIKKNNNNQPPLREEDNTMKYFLWLYGSGSVEKKSGKAKIKS